MPEPTSSTKYQVVSQSKFSGSNVVVKSLCVSESTFASELLSLVPRPHPQLGESLGTRLVNC